MRPLFLHLDEVLALHRQQVRLFGGDPGIRELHLLESAIGTPAATFDGVFIHETLLEMAAAYLFSICRNHPFIDGNKRTAVAAALTFLEMNHVEIVADEDEFYDLVIGVAEGRVSKPAVALFLERNVVRADEIRESLDAIAEELEDRELASGAARRVLENTEW